MNVQDAKERGPPQQRIRGALARAGDGADRYCKVGGDEEIFVVAVRVSVLSNGVAPSHPRAKIALIFSLPALLQPSISFFLTLVVSTINFVTAGL